MVPQGSYSLEGGNPLGNFNGLAPPPPFSKLSSVGKGDGIKGSHSPERGDPSQNSFLTLLPMSTPLHVSRMSNPKKNTSPQITNTHLYTPPSAPRLPHLPRLRAKRHLLSQRRHYPQGPKGEMGNVCPSG